MDSDLSVIQVADSLPREMLLDRPQIGLYQAWLLLNQGNIEKAYPLLQDMEQRLAGSLANSGQHWIWLISRLALAFLTPPAIALLALTWVYLVASVFLCVDVMIFKGTERAQLTKAFGKEYEDYLTRVDQLIPFVKPGKWSG